MAVLDGFGGSESLAGTGKIQIDDNCVTMRRPDGVVFLLIWHAAEVSWDGKEREITFSSPPPPQPLRIRDGDIITVGGEGLQDDVPVKRNLQWLATPSPSCDGRQWSVSSVTKP